MHRNIEISKETLDKVRLAKKYIEDRYQGLLDCESTIKNMEGKKCEKKKMGVGSKNGEQAILKRLQRQKDCLKNYRLHSLIGRGAFGEVRLGQEISTGECVAIKRLKKQRIAEKKQIYNSYLEKELMGKSESRYIIQMRSAFQDEHYLYIVMEYAPGGDLLHLLIEKDILTEEETRFYIAEMVLAVEEVHKMGFAHRDIKPDNILLDRHGHLKVTDFGLSKLMDSGKRKKGRLSKLDKLEDKENRERIFSKVGTPDYISPEVLTDNTYDESIDIWGIGVIMFECLYGYPPFTDEDSSKVCCHVMDWLEYLEFPEDIKASTPAKMLILGCINDRAKRLTIEQIKRHSFFEDIDWKKLHKSKAPYIPDLKDHLDVGNFDKIELEEPWTVDEVAQQKSQRMSYPSQTPQQAVVKENNQKSSRLFYSFAGFDFQRRVRKEIMEKQSNLLGRKSCPQKSIKKVKAVVQGQLKRLKTEGTYKTVEKTPFTSYLKDLKNMMCLKVEGDAKKENQNLKMREEINFEGEMEKKVKKISRAGIKRSMSSNKWGKRSWNQPNQISLKGKCRELRE